MQRFAYSRPESLDEALADLDAGGEDARVIAGGQSLIPLMNLGLAYPEQLIDLSRVRDLRGIDAADGQWRIGAMTTHSELLGTASEFSGLIAAAVAQVGSERIRNLGTVGGSVSHADPSAEVPLAMLVSDATYEVHSGDGGSRKLPAAELALGQYMTSLEDNEILTAVHVSGLGRQRGWGFHEYARRAGDFAVVAAAALVDVVDGRFSSPAVGLAGVSDAVLRCEAVERHLDGADPDGIDEAVAAGLEEIEFKADAYTSSAYRATLARVLIRRCLQDAHRRAMESLS